MKLSKFSKYLIGALTLWPIINYSMVFIVGFRYLFPLLIKMGKNPSSITSLPPLLYVIAIFNIFTWIVVFSLIIFYVVHIMKNEQLLDNHKILWVLLVFFGYSIGQLVYWFLHVRTGPPEKITT